MSAGTQNSYMYNQSSAGSSLSGINTTSSNNQSWTPINMSASGPSNVGQQRTQAWSAPVSNTQAWSAPVSNTQAWSAPVSNTSNSISTQAWSAPVNNTQAWSAPVSTTSNTQAWSAPVSTTSNTQAWSAPTNTNVPWTPQVNPGYGIPQSGMLPLITSKSTPNTQWSSATNLWTGSSTPQRFILEDSVPNQTQVPKNATVGQLLTNGPGTSKGILFDSKVVLKQICGMGNVKGNLDFFSGMCTMNAPEDEDGSLSEDSDSDDEDNEEEEDDYVRKQPKTVQQPNVQSIPILKSEDDILPQESEETVEEYSERKRYYDLILKTKYSGHAYIYSRTLAWRGRPGTHYSADVLNTLTIIERAIETLSKTTQSVVSDFPTQTSPTSKVEIVTPTPETTIIVESAPATSKVDSVSDEM